MQSEEFFWIFITRNYRLCASDSASESTEADHDVSSTEADHDISSRAADHVDDLETDTVV